MIEQWPTSPQVSLTAAASAGIERELASATAIVERDLADAFRDLLYAR